MTIKAPFLSFVFLLILIGCSDAPTDNKGNAENTPPKQETVVTDSVIIKIYLREDGSITADGNPVTLTELDSALTKHEGKNSIVYYSRANPNGDPPAGFEQILDLVFKHGYSFRFYTDSTFSEVFKPH